MPTEELTTPEFVAATGVPSGTVHMLCRRGLLKPAFAGTPGCRSGHRWTVAQALALAAWRALRQRGVRADDAERARLWLESLSEQALHERFARGEELLLVTGDRCAASLVTMRAVLAAVGDTAGSGSGVLASGVNLRQLAKHLSEAAACRNGAGDLTGGSSI